ncbi:unnamed protein product [Allacma fusca]|uniref:Uncharacterized protein n=1 Tax=Allacma fusca TaxID=39272 RepID=A0A8J2P575_9HEXA|nr:unnamed protein product [Allacma fusca]
MRRACESRITVVEAEIFFFVYQMTKESEKSLKVTRNVEATSAGGGGGSVIRLRASSGQSTPNNKKQRNNMAPSSEPSTTHSSQNGHQEDQVNGIRPQKPACCLCWCCCCSCSW